MILMRDDERAQLSRAFVPRACAACAGALTEAAWLALPLAQTILPATILQHLSTWPADEHVEVRRCRDCGRSIARKARARVGG